MEIKDIETVLTQLAAQAPSEIDGSAASERLNECLAVLRRETGFRLAPASEAISAVPYAFVQAADFTESAARAFTSGEASVAIERCREALEQLKRIRRG